MNRPLATIAVGLLLAAAPAGSAQTGSPLAHVEALQPAPVEPGTPQGLTDPGTTDAARERSTAETALPEPAALPALAPPPVPRPLTLPAPLPPVAPGTPATDATLLREVQRRAAQIEAAGETLGEQQAELTRIREELAAHTTLLARLDQELSERQRVTDDLARDAYISARHLPETMSQTPALLSVFPTSGEVLDEARSQVLDAQSRYQAGAEAELLYAATVTGHEAQFQAALGELTALRSLHESTLAREQAAMDDKRREAGRQRLTGFGGANSKGMVPGPAALRAVEYALAQQGKDYVFGAEGPDTFDCSGLVQAAYGQAGVKLPRTARPQWRATTPVSTEDLLAGDLIFFGTDRSNWDSIYHVGVYVGRGEMMHAPMPGDVLKLAPIWWEDFFGATRVVPAVPGKGKPEIPLPPKPAPAPSPATPVPPASPAPPATPPKNPPKTPSGTPTPTVPPVPPVDPPETPETAPTLGTTASAAPTEPAPAPSVPVLPELSAPALIPALDPTWRGRVPNVGNVR